MNEAALRFVPDRGAYLRSHAVLAAVAMAGAMAVLWLLDSAHPWTGAVAGLAAIAFRGWFLASEELDATWSLAGGALTGPGGQRVPLAQIAAVNRLGSFVQLVTRGGDKHLIKYQADPAATIAAIERARA